MLLMAKYLTLLWKFTVIHFESSTLNIFLIFKETIWIYILMEYNIMVENKVLTKFRNLCNMFEVIVVCMLLIIVSNKLWYSTNQSRNCSCQNLQIFLHTVTEQQSCDKTDVGLKKKKSLFRVAVCTLLPSHHQSHF